MVLAVFMGGCNPGITEPDELVITKIDEYFWHTDTNGSLVYENYIVKDAKKSLFEYTFSPLAGAVGEVSVSRIPAPGYAFYYKYDSAGSLLAGGMSYNTLFPLPDGYQTSGATTFDTSYSTVNIRKVLALPSSKVVAIDDSDNVFYSVNNGISWQKSAFKADNYGRITSWTKVGEKPLVYAGTSLGYCLVSSDGGINWTVKTRFGEDPITSIAVSSTGNMFATAPKDSLYIYDIASSRVTKMDYPPAITSVAVCDAVKYSGNQYNMFIVSTDSAMYYWAFGSSQSFGYGKNLENTYEHSHVTATGKSTAVALGYKDALEQTLLCTSDGGQTWGYASLPIQNVRFISASMASNSPNFVVANESGEIQVGYHYANSIPTFSDVNTTSSRFHINDISMSSTAIIAAVDSVGIIVSTDNGQTWAIGSKGLSKMSVTPHKGNGYITLLENHTGGIRKGDMWDAGVLTSTNGSAVQIITLMAEVKEAWSKLDLPFGAGTYENVFEVTYTCTSPDRKKHTVHVFYAKYIGPILFQRFIGDDLIDESYLKKK